MATLDRGAEGVPYPSSDAGVIDRWSFDVYTALGPWPTKKRGSWSRWKPGYLLLQIATVEETPIEPAVLYTADEEVTVAFGMWLCHLPEKGTTAADAAAEAISLIDGWTSGVTKTLVFTSQSGNWRGTIPVFGGALDELISRDRAWLDNLAPEKAELRCACRSQWREYRFIGGRLLDASP